MGVDAQADLVSETARLKAAIDGVAEGAEIALSGRFDASGAKTLGTEHEELTRQVGALRQRVDVALGRNEGPGALRAELATLLFFARTLEADAEAWRSELRDQVDELERQRRAAVEARERLVDDRRVGAGGRPSPPCSFLARATTPAIRHSIGPCWVATRGSCTPSSMLAQT